MNAKATLSLTILACILLYSTPTIHAADADKSVDLTEKMKKSLLYLNISAHAYTQMQPWRRTDVAQKFGYACAVGPYEAITVARNISNASFIKARRHGKNEFITAVVKVIDYESNLCLLTLDRETMSKPLVPIKFSTVYEKGAELKAYWLSANSHLTTARAYLDRAEVNRSTSSYAGFLNYVVANTSNVEGRARLYCIGKKPIGIAAWANIDAQEAGLIPAETINKFLDQARKKKYDGFGTAGFTTRILLDPAMREFLKMPKDLKHGIYVSKVYNLATASDILQPADVILAIDKQKLNPYGRFEHPRFDKISFRHLITNHKAGDTINFEIWRDGKKLNLKTKAKNFNAPDMLVPFYEYSEQPEYIVIAGFVFQKLTRPYLQMWGDNWTGKVPPHLFHYYRDTAFNPTEQRTDIVILSYVLPAEINLGYQGLGRMVVKTFNGMTISAIADIPKAMQLKPESKYHIIKFEHDYPTVVIPRENLLQTNQMIAERYGITKLYNIEQ
jgi:hypothetical protein